MNNKIVIACDKYKGSLTALQVCRIIQKAIQDQSKDINTVISPMADGGEGTVDALIESYGGEIVYTEVLNPSGKKIKSYFGLIDEGKTAVIEMSLASGISLIPVKDRNPLITTTFGTGQLIKAALDRGCKKIIIGIGGSATNDAGMGALQALGVRFFDKKGNELGLGGSELLKINEIDVKNIHPNISSTEIFIACDVDNPLFGKNGAAYVYGPQKGADNKDVEILNKGLINFNNVLKRQFNKDVSNLRGAGAAGGLGGGLAALIGAKLKPGAELIIAATNLESKIKDADLVITGEGAMDNQTFYGKSAYGVAIAAAKYNVSTITIDGSVNINYEMIEKEKHNLFSGNFDTVSRIMTIDEAIKNGKELLYSAAREIIKFYLSTLKIREAK